MFVSGTSSVYYYFTYWVGCSQPSFYLHFITQLHKRLKIRTTFTLAWLGLGRRSKESHPYQLQTREAP